KLSLVGSGMCIRARAYSDYQACASKLLPMNYDQVRQTQVGFPGGGIVLDQAAKARLDVLLEYMKADPSVNQVALDGHSDNSGNRLTNRDLSRRRALAVADYLMAHGVPESQITVRFHGERYPLAKNNSAGNRARNRRVNIELERGPAQAQPTQKAVEAPAAPAAPAQAASATKPVPDKPATAK
uniref:OmpA family protein n=1 Tax=Pseudomonas sp. KCJK9111 TaxID=3344555 RepID=UPI003905FDAE